ncbi:hypothetical protein COT77_00755 [Candidatus Berkelbacteria bacterium CG10_big_fil_rev_8_21_14_0_10_41_12]|uniref:Uncharacterized protein n=1 Tax=Candidatus Berkelbacteria bacterium CG10_big_fil_rev_8_21_14_0_10_41_12 TaxID=1974513 RepID=A0A2M6WXS9_9BACT|nr:MAG: hypothetical protein COT77_00755 [Candidatus Berkelbacteria bacterium CG10_big_fil_rev_8_21_14_0_10_41_12]
MKWIGISGSWRKTNKQVERDVRCEVDKILKVGNGIVSGGALNVDFFATDEVMKLNPKCDKIKIFLPATLILYKKHYMQRAREGVITANQAEILIKQLKELKRKKANLVIENVCRKSVDEDGYYQRDTEVIKHSDELIAFHVNKSAGTQDTIEKAKQKGIPVKVFRYTIK